MFHVFYAGHDPTQPTLNIFLLPVCPAQQHVSASTKLKVSNLDKTEFMFGLTKLFNLQRQGVPLKDREADSPLAGHGPWSSHSYPLWHQTISLCGRKSLGEKRFFFQYYKTRLNSFILVLIYQQWHSKQLNWKCDWSNYFFCCYYMLCILLFYKALDMIKIRAIFLFVIV